MRQMVIDYGMTQDGVETRVITLDTNTRLYANMHHEFINIETAVDAVVNMIMNVDVDVVYADSNGLGSLFIELLDKRLEDNRCPTIIDSIKQVAPETMYRPREVALNGHKITTAFDY